MFLEVTRGTATATVIYDSDCKCKQKRTDRAMLRFYFIYISRMSWLKWFILLFQYSWCIHNSQGIWNEIFTFYFLTFENICSHFELTDFMASNTECSVTSKLCFEMLCSFNLFTSTLILAMRSSVFAIFRSFIQRWGSVFSGRSLYLDRASRVRSIALAALKCCCAKFKSSYSEKKWKFAI